MTAEQLAAIGMALANLNLPMERPIMAIKTPRDVDRMMATGENPFVEMNCVARASWTTTQSF